MSWGSDFRTYWTRLREQHALLESSDSRDICNQRNYSNQVLSRLRLESWVSNPISHSLCTIGVFQIHASYFSTETTVTIWNGLHHGHIVRGLIPPSSCWEYFTTHIQLWWSLNPTVTQSFLEWLSYPSLCTNPEVFRCGLLSHRRGLHHWLSKSCGVRLFRQTHPFKFAKRWRQSK